MGTLLPAAAPAARGQTLSWPVPTLSLVVDGLDEPVYLTDPDDGSNRLFVVERPGSIQIIQDGELLAEPFLDIRGQVDDTCSECGMLSMAFPPDFPQANHFFVYYNALEEVAEPGEEEDDPNGGNDTVVARFQVRSDDPNRADPASETRILLQNQPARNHNGGLLTFGPDGYLYLGLGDGGGGGDTFENAQNLNTLLGKLLRIEVGPTGTYSIPDANPFVGDPNARGEIWAYGLRNPWRFAFDPRNDDLYIADVGQQDFEEINVQPGTSSGGENYGWNAMEGDSCYDGQDCDPSSYTLPVWVYGHENDNCSITGGVIYTSPDLAQEPVYLYGDFCSGRVHALQRDGDGWASQQILNSGAAFGLVSFGQDHEGHAYLLDQEGAVYRFFEPQHRFFYPLLPNTAAGRAR